jgi:hypothetical protein
MYLAKTCPGMFVTSEVAKEALCSLLKRDMKVILAQRGALLTA